MQNINQKLSRYQTASVIKYPMDVDPSTAFRYCENNCLPSAPNNAEFSKPFPEGINVSNTLGDGIGTESFAPRTLQEKVELIHQEHIPYVMMNGPTEIPLSKVINNNQNYTFPNQEYVGVQSKRSAIPSVIAPPSHAEEYWKTNDFLVRSGINSETVIDLTRSGYLMHENNDISNVIEPFEQNENMSKKTIVMEHDPKTGSINMVDNTDMVKNGTIIENFNNDTDDNVEYNYTSNLQKSQPNTIEVPPEQCTSTNNSIPSFQTGTGCKKELLTVVPPIPDTINQPYGYNADQLVVSNIPGNLPVGYLDKEPVFNEFNKEIFTTSIQPNVHSRTQVIEPINSNIGVSFTQQFEPVECEQTQNGGVVFVQKDPRIQPIYQKVDITPDGPNESNVYDPRFTGYGTNYRSYIDNVTGQPRFYYDDVTVHRQNNYLTRNKIDFTDFGPSNNNINQKYTNSQIRTMAQDTFADKTIDFRTDMQSKLLRKANVNAWQQKLAPLNPGGI